MRNYKRAIQGSKLQWLEAFEFKILQIPVNCLSYKSGQVGLLDFNCFFYKIYIPRVLLLINVIRTIFYYHHSTKLRIRCYSNNLHLRFVISLIDI